MPSRRIAQIDVLRGFAALWVVLSHYFPHWQKYLGPSPIIVPNEWGYHAVELFFVISGFVIFMTLEKCQKVSDFLLLRFSRLYPTYWATLILGVTIGVVVFDAEFWPSGFLANLTMFQEFLGRAPFDVVYWSLTVELAFYLNTAWIFALGLHRHVLPATALWLALAAVWAIALRDPAATERDWPSLLLALDFAPYFAIGILYYHASRSGWSSWSLGLLLLAFLVQWIIGGGSGLAVALIIAALVGLAVHGRLSFLVNPVTMWLGAISYALFLVHRNLGYHVLDWMHTVGMRPEAAVPITILGAMALATALNRWIERPAATAIRDWYAARRGATQLAS